MFVVGLTGGIGSGKSAVSSRLEKIGITVVDADIVAREVVEPGTPSLKAIAEHFGKEILQTDGSLDRAALRKKVFASVEQRKWLEQLLHPVIRQRIIELTESSASDYIVLVSPLLLETDQHQLTDHIVVVDVDEQTQIERTCRRDNNNEAQVKAIIAAQISRSERCSRADDIIDNSGDEQSLIPQIEKLHARLLTLALEHRKES